MKFLSLLTARTNQSRALRSLHHGQAASHGVAEDGSPRREPWGKNSRSPKAPPGATEFRPKMVFFHRNTALVSITSNPRLTPSADPLLGRKCNECDNIIRQKQNITRKRKWRIHNSYRWMKSQAGIRNAVPVEDLNIVKGNS